MLQIECEVCKRRFWVEGHTTPDIWTGPGEVVTELISEDELCPCLNDGGSFEVVDESHQQFDDDVL